MTRYVVLKAFKVLDTVEAHNADEAMTKAYLGAEDSERSNVVVLAAVPERSFKPMMLRLETKPKLILSEPPEDAA